MCAEEQEATLLLDEVPLQIIANLDGVDSIVAHFPEKRRIGKKLVRHRGPSSLSIAQESGKGNQSEDANANP